jgi:hypothetical protein
MKILPYFLFAALVLLSASNAMALDFCTRHFYYNSEVYWTVFMPSPNTCNGSSGACSVKPHSVAELGYSVLTLASGIGVQSKFYNHGFSTGPCEIFHSGNTGAVAVNDPANGDVTTCGGSGWPCPSQARRRSNHRR